MTTDHVVALKQHKPYEIVVLDIFTEESDAIDYAETYAYGRDAIRSSKHRWRLTDTDYKTALIIFKRKRECSNSIGEDDDHA